MTVPKEVETKKARISGLGITEQNEFTSERLPNLLLHDMF
jgi:hypothetical protein